MIMNEMIRSGNATAVWPGWLAWVWSRCCLGLGVSPQSVRAYFHPWNDIPYWFDDSYVWTGAALWEDGRQPEIAIFTQDIDGRDFSAMALREIIYHELVHILKYDAPEHLVVDLTAVVSRRREGWREVRRILRAEAFEKGLGPGRGSMTLFQWARRRNTAASRYRSGD